MCIVGKTKPLLFESIYDCPQSSSGKRSTPVQIWVLTTFWQLSYKQEKQKKKTTDGKYKSTYTIIAT